MMHATTSRDREGRTMELSEGVVEDDGPASGSRTSEPSRTASSFRVAVGTRSIEAQRAASCLLIPSAGDHVLVSRPTTSAGGAERAFILAILEREPSVSKGGESDASSGGHTIVLGPDVTLSTDAGTVRFTGAKNVDIGASGSVSIASPEIALRADKLGAVLRRVEIVGHTLETSFDRVRSMARSIDALADQLTQTLKRSVRLVSETDLTRAHRIDTRAEATLSMHGDHTTITARGVTKLDSDQIHIG